MRKKPSLRSLAYLAAILILCLPMLSLLGCGGECPEEADLPPVSQETFDEDVWRAPPTYYHPYVRWWWPGGAVEADEIQREMGLFLDAGFGGVEVQAFLHGLTPQEIDDDSNVRTVGTAGFFKKLRVVAEEADKRNMSFDFTLESGWPSGGPFISRAPERALARGELQ